MNYYVYYQEDGFIAAISPAFLKEWEHLPYLTISEEVAKPFLTFIEPLFKWKVKNNPDPQLIKEDDPLLFGHNEKMFFDIKQQPNVEENFVIFVTINQNTITIRSQLQEEFSLFLTKKDDPSVIIQTLTISPGEVRKTFIVDDEDFSIFSDKFYGQIQWQST